MITKGNSFFFLIPQFFQSPQLQPLYLLREHNSTRGIVIRLIE